MESHEHNGIVELFRECPELAAEVLAGLLHIDLPKWEEARPEPNELKRHAPAPYFADHVVSLWTRAERVQAVIVEVQLDTVKEKRRRWPVYVTRVHDELECPAHLLVVCPDPKVARWAATPIPLGHPGFTLTPLVLGPDLVPLIDKAKGGAKPELAVLSALAHGAGPERTTAFHGLLAGLGSFDGEHRGLYAEIVAKALPEAARRELEALFMDLKTYEPQSDVFRPHWLRGKAEGEARAVLVVLGVRGIEVPEDARQRITECTDLDTLEVWVRRAATVASVEELFD